MDPKAVKLRGEREKKCGEDCFAAGKKQKD